MSYHMSKRLNKHLLDSFSILNTVQKREFIKLCIGLVVHIVLDLFSLVSILPLLLITLNPENIARNRFLSEVYLFLEFNNPQDFILVSLLIVLLFFFAKTLFSYRVLKWKASYASNVAIDLSNNMFEGVFDETTDENSGEKINNIVNIPYAFIYKTLYSFFNLITGTQLIALVMISLILYDFQVFLYLLVVLIPSVFVFFLIQGKTLKKIRTELKKHQPSILQNTLEIVEGKIEIILANSKDVFIRKFSDLNKKYNGALAQLDVAVSSSSKFIELIAIVGICILFFYFSVNSNNREELFLFLTIYTVSAYKLIPSINSINVAYTNLKVHQYVTEILKEQIHAPRKRSNQEAIEALNFEEQICFFNISYKYPSSTFKLSNVSFSIKKNDRVAIIGESGAGKSTLVKILLRILVENDGKVIVDSEILSPLNLSTWRAKISYVPQSVFLFEGSILENICMKSDRLNELRPKAIETIEKLGLEELINTFKGGIDSKISEKGTNVSTGQKQRLGIARALLQDRDVMVFDEITSNLDSVNQQSVLKTILKAAELNKTLIFATHQPEIVSLCNVIIEVVNGTVVVTRKVLTR